MIRIGGKDITSINAGSRAIAAVYYGVRLVWQAIRAWSCYGIGYWRRDKVWRNDECWRGF